MCLLSCLAQTILFVLNFLLSMVSLAVTGIGILMQIESSKVSDAVLQNLGSAPIIVIVVGCIFSGIFFCGCCGALLKNRCLLITYSVITIILATAAVVLTVFIFKGVDQIKDSKDVLTESFSNPQNKVTLGWIEATLGCCGTTGPDYYYFSIPMSCCPSEHEDLIQNIKQGNIDLTGIKTLTNYPWSSINLTCRDSEAYQQGCVDVSIEKLGEIFKITGQVLISIIVIEYAAALLAMFLSCFIGK